MTASATAPSARDRPPPDDIWTVLRMIRWSGEYLRSKGVERGRLDAEHLLADLLGCGRLELYLQYDRPLTGEEREGFKERLLRRAAREPLQYILGRTAFRELDLVTDRRVLIPRPETEQLVEAVLEWVRKRAPVEEGGLTALDVGTGSGAIAISLALEGPFDRIVATDPSPEALEVARLNVDAMPTARARHPAAEAEEVTGVELRQGGGYEPVVLRPERFDVIVSNPPYVAAREAEALQPEVRDWEPASALLAGVEGLDVLTPLVRDASAHLREGGLLALETGEGQAVRVAGLIEKTRAFAPARIIRDLAGKDRFVLAERRSAKNFGMEGGGS